MYLNTIKRKKESRKLVTTADFETCVINNRHLVICYSIYDRAKTPTVGIIPDNYTDIHLESKKLMKSFLDELFKSSKRELVYFHNGSKFDFMFLLDYVSLNPQDYQIDLLTRDNVIYKIKIKKQNRVIEIRDSYQILKDSLAKLAASIGLNKINFFEDDITENDLRSTKYRISLVKYCIKDSMLLYKILEHYRTLFLKDFQIDITNSYTVASMALKCFRTHFYKDYTIYIPNGNVDQFIRKSYFGGRVEVFRPHLKEGYHYDVNSLYPTVMHDFDYPKGKGEFISIMSEQYDLSLLGFYEVIVNAPDTLYIPFLVLKDSKIGLVSPVGSFEGVYFSEEIKYAMTLGYKFFFKKGYVFQEKEKIFQGYIKHLYDKRIQSAKNSPTNIITKLLMNSLYGRFGMKPEISISKLCSEDELRTILLTRKDVNYHEINNVYMVKYQSNVDIKHLLSLKRQGLIDKETFTNAVESSNYVDSKSAVQIASAVTAYARIYMHKLYTHYSDSLYYTDTDSLFLSKQANSENVSENELGKLRFEGKIYNGYFIAPKAYSFETYDDSNNLVVTTKMSGFPTDQIDPKFIKNYFHDEINELTINRKFSRLFKEFAIYDMHIDATTKRTNLKREKVYSDNIWADTKPLKYEK